MGPNILYINTSTLNWISFCLTWMLASLKVYDKDGFIDFLRKGITFLLERIVHCVSQLWIKIESNREKSMGRKQRVYSPSSFFSSLLYPLYMSLTKWQQTEQKCGLRTLCTGNIKVRVLQWIIKGETCYKLIFYEVLKLIKDTFPDVDFCNLSNV